uniref:Uncharacterized protein n=1 Tax=Arundo donax TaxID=35708 RepID=A0A0A9BXM3_ARUDO
MTQNTVIDTTRAMIKTFLWLLPLLLPSAGEDEPPCRPILTSGVPS